MKRLWMMGMLGTASLLGCAEGQRGFFGQEKASALTLKAPQTDRCAHQPANAKASCQDLQRSATEWVKHLQPDDEICLENGVGDFPTKDCTARASIKDTSVEGLLVEVRHADLSKRWKPYELRQVWFDTAAFVDMDLKEKGYE